MGYAGRSRTTSSTVDPLELYEREMARRGRAIRTTKAVQKGQYSAQNAAVKDALHWLNTPFRVHDPLKVQRLLGLALERRYAAIRWDPTKPKGKRIQSALPWKNRTRTLRRLVETEIEEFRQIGYHPPTPLGPSVSEVLEAAAIDFKLSTTTLRRLVRGEAKSLSWVFAERLRKRLRPEEWAKLERALLSPGALKLRDRYAKSVEAEIERHTLNRNDDNLGVSYSPAERREIASFERHAQLLGAPATRGSLALLRVYGPLMMWRPLNENLRNVKPEDRLRFVRHGLRRELWLVRIEMQLFRRAAKLR